MLKRWTSALVALIAAVVLVSGCGKTEDKAGKGKETGGKDKGGEVAKSKHDGWWCDEHGIPEGECSKCSSKVAKECKAKGDWCKEHEIAKSQCFVCDPSLMEKYAAQYKAKFGKAPPPPEDNMPKKDETKKDK